jgi:hypothetical protein
MPAASRIGAMIPMMLAPQLENGATTHTGADVESMM